MACGASGGSGAPLPDATADGSIASDGPADDGPRCTAATVAAKGVDVDTTVEAPLTLDGVGTRCEQLARAILDPAQRPPAIAELDAQSGVGSPLCIEYPEVDAVRIDVNELLGRRLLSGGQWLLAWVRRSDTTVVELTGWYVTPPAEPPTSCASGSALADAVVGHEQPYTTFQLCAPTGDGVWKIGDGDVREPGEVGWFHDGEQLRVAREISVGVEDAAITQQLRDSDLNCCAVVDEQAGCIGIVLIVDAESGKVLDTRRRCLVC